MSSTKAEIKKELILKAVSQIVHEEGVEKLTLEAVAKKAGISKGGLLYHFPSKEALLQGMVEHLSNRFLEEFHQKAEEDPRTMGKWTRAYMDASLSCDSEVGDLYTALSAAHFANPELLQVLQEQYFKMQALIEDDAIDPVKSTMIRLALDGLWFAEMFGLAPPHPELRQKIVEELKRRLEENE
ncbi:TetR family transcriptional regulator [Paenibacillus sp. CAA11]|nr:TetR family transcriptional regulator [Paenibacillus sp. CAA11]